MEEMLVNEVVEEAVKVAPKNPKAAIAVIGTVAVVAGTIVVVKKLKSKKAATAEEATCTDEPKIEVIK